MALSKNIAAGGRSGQIFRLLRFCRRVQVIGGITFAGAQAFS